MYVFINKTLLHVAFTSTAMVPAEPTNHFTCRPHNNNYLQVILNKMHLDRKGNILI